jgi:hypothetical protein
MILSRLTGEVRTFANVGFFCLYESGDCSGACLVLDRRWQGLVVRNSLGNLLVAAHTAVDQGPKTIHSFVDAAGVCHEDTITTAESYLAQAYVPKDFSFPLKAPLDWRQPSANP